MYQTALDMLLNNDTHGDDPSWNKRSPLIGNIQISRAGVHFHRGRLMESLQTLQESEAHFVNHKDDGGPPHVDLIKCLQHQGLVHRSMHDYELASQAYTRALTVLDNLQHQDSSTTLGEAPPTMDATASYIYHERRQGLQLDLADMLAAMDQNEPACNLYQQILDDDRRKSNERTALQGILLHNLGRLHAQAESTRELALVELTEALAIKQEFVGDTHPEVLKTLLALGALQGVLKNPRAALQCFQQSLLLARMQAADGDQEHDETVMLILRNISVLKGEKVAKWGEEE
jgi:tetratricopeptide (TPR) repeat protein